MKLRPYQEEDVQQLIKHKSHGIFNEQRTGKTPTSLIAMTRMAKGKILVVATASMLFKWKEEVETWTDREAIVYTGTARQRTSAFEEFKESTNKILVISYGLLKNTKGYRGLRDELKKIGVDGLIVDEVHRAVGRKTANFQALRYLVTIPHRYYLTGTPAPNHPSQVWSILTLINPKEFSSYWRFAEDFFKIEEIRLPPHLRGAMNPKDVTEFLPGMDDVYVDVLDNNSIMRKRKDVMPWLPEQEEPTRIRLPLTVSQQRHLKEMQAYYETDHVMVQGVLDQILRCRQICLAPELLDLRGPSPKINWLKDYLLDYSDKQVVIFSRFTQFIKLIKENIPHVGVLVGETPIAERNQLIKSFQSGTLSVLVIQIDAGKEGITLDSADTLIFTDIFPPASDILQAKDRIVATTPERNKPKEIIELMMADSYDEVLYDMVQSKIELTDIANNYINYLERSEAID